MDFYYWFLVQDVIGVLLAALGFKFAIIYFMIMRRRSITIRYLFCFIGNIMLILSGINLIFSYWSFKTWGISFALFISAWLFGRLVYISE